MNYKEITIREIRIQKRGKRWVGIATERRSKGKGRPKNYKRLEENKRFGKREIIGLDTYKKENKKQGIARGKMEVQKRGK